MRIGTKWTAIGAAAAVMLLAAGVAGIAQDKLAQVTSRQEFMKAQGADAKKIADYSKGQGDQADALAAANDLLARAPKINDQFAPGTSSTDFPGKSNAKPELWTDMAKVKEIPTALQAEEVKLVEAIKTGDKDKVAAQMGATVKAGCGACHGTYRVKTS